MLERRGLVEQTLTTMRRRIASGEWSVGERIPTEPELAASLGVGRSTVREAVRALVNNGVLSVRQGDGTRVLARSEVSGVVRKQLQTSERDHVLEVRRALEVEAARLAAGRRTQADLRRLSRALSDREKAWENGDVDTWLDHDVAFHVAMVEASHNPVLTQLYGGFTELLRASIGASVTTGLARENHVDHDALLDAIRDRDADAAAREVGGMLVQVSAARSP